MRRRFALITAGVFVLALGVGLASSGAVKQRSATRTYLVLYEKGASKKSARAAIKRSGARITAENRRIGLASVRSRTSNFAGRVARSKAVYGAARNRPIGTSFDRRPADP